MTYSILVRDPVSGHMGGAAATGSLCVGGWVLRGDPRAGMSASQGAAPSTFWGEDVLAAMRGGLPAGDAVSRITQDDAGREARQLSALDRSGTAAAFTGCDNTPKMGSTGGSDLIAAGNLLKTVAVLDAAADGYAACKGDLADRLLAALKAGAQAGGDSRGLLSAAILVVGEDIPPLSLRVDFDAHPLQRLEALLKKTRQGDYAGWLETVPVLKIPDKRARRPDDPGSR